MPWITSSDTWYSTHHTYSHLLPSTHSLYIHLLTTYTLLTLTLGECTLDQGAPTGIDVEALRRECEQLKADKAQLEATIQQLNQRGPPN